MSRLDDSQSLENQRDSNVDPCLKQSDNEPLNRETANSCINNSSEESDMEVHVKHHNRGGHKFREYIYEFFMLFLAVTAGFFVENIRETKVEHHRELQYINSLVDDIKLDTTSLNRIIKHCTRQMGGIDTLLRELEKANSPRMVPYLYHYSIQYLSGVYIFNYTDRTISQLKNAGGLRLIQSSAVSDGIVVYSSGSELIEKKGDYLIEYLTEILKKEKDLIDYKYVHSSGFDGLLTNSSLKLLPGDPKRINLYYNDVYLFRLTFEDYRSDLINMREYVGKLLATIHKEYKLE